MPFFLKMNHKMVDMKFNVSATLNDAGQCEFKIGFGGAEELLTKEESRNLIDDLIAEWVRLYGPWQYRNSE